MDAKIVFDTFLNDLKVSFADIVVPEYSVEEQITLLEESYYPDVVRILQRDATFFDTERLFLSRYELF
jgi:hypothetical protein